MTRYPMAMLLALAVLITMASAPDVAAANGGKAKSKILHGQLANGSGECTLVAEIDPLLFAITALRDKYRLIRVKIINESDTPLRLSATTDKAEVIVGGRTIAAVLDLQSKDPALWDALPASLRKLLAYPSVVDPHEEESAILYIPDLTLDRAPEAIRFTLASSDSTVLLAAPVAAQ